MGITQKELGDAVGVSFQQIQKYEKGANRIGASTLSCLSTALGCKPSDFFLEAAAVSDDDFQIESISQSQVDLINKLVRSVEGFRLATLFLSIESQYMRKHIISLMECASNIDAATRKTGLEQATDV